MKEEITRILSLNDTEVKSYVRSRLLMFDMNSNDMEISLDEGSGDIYSGWLSTDSIYLPSGMRSKGFKIDEQFFIDAICDMRVKFGSIPIDKLRTNINVELVVKWFNLFVMDYFGVDYDEVTRKMMYGYGSLNSIGETISLSSLKGCNVTRCIEKSAALNSLLTFLGIDSSLVLSDANGVGHAYCLVSMDGKLMIVDPNFLAKGKSGKGIPYVFELDVERKVCQFDPSVFGDYSALMVDYSFPFDKIVNVKNK